MLVVDDQAPFRSAARAVLRRLEGFEFAGEASSGPEAIELVDRLHPALVLMDINMPEMTGIEATRQIVSAHPDVVVILCSTYDAADLPPAAAASGATACRPERMARGGSGGSSPGPAQPQAASSSGMVPRTWAPSPGCDSQRTVPPIAPSRSAMLTKP